MTRRRPLTVLEYLDTWLLETENWIYTMIRFLPQDRIRTSIVCEWVFEPERRPVDHLYVHSRTVFGRLRPSWLFRRLQGHTGATARIPQIARTLDAKLLHSHFGPAGWRASGSAKRAGLRHIVSFYGVDLGKLPRSDHMWLARYQEELFPAVDLVLCEGEFSARQIRELGCPRAKIAILHLGIPLDEYPFSPREWNPRETLRILVSASFREKKGIPYAIEALARVGQEVPLEITVIGDARPGDDSQAREKEKVLQTLKACGLSGRTRLLGYQPHDILKTEAREHHIFVSTSVTASDGDNEGGAPVTLIEMQALGVPVVSSFHCDIPSVVLHGVTGRLARERDVDDIAAQIRWWIDHHGAWRNMLEAGRRHVEQEYDAVRQAGKLAQIYEEVARWGVRDRPVTWGNRERGLPDGVTGS